MHYYRTKWALFTNGQLVIIFHRWHNTSQDENILVVSKAVRWNDPRLHAILAGFALATADLLLSTGEEAKALTRSLRGVVNEDYVALQDNWVLPLTQELVTGAAFPRAHIPKVLSGDVATMGAMSHQA